MKQVIKHWLLQASDKVKCRKIDRFTTMIEFENSERKHSPAHFFFFSFKDLQLYLPIIDNKVLLLHQLREILASSIELFKEDPHFQIANKYSYNQWRIYKLILLS